MIAFTHVYIFLLVGCLLFFLARLGRLDWLHLQPSHSRGGAKRSRLHRLRHRPAAQTIAPPVVSSPLPRRAWSQHLHLHLCAPGARSKAVGEHLSEYTPRASLVPTSRARTSASPMPTFMPWLAMANMAVPNGSRPFEALRAIPRSLPGATLPCTV